MIRDQARPLLVLALEPAPGSCPSSDWARTRKALKGLLRSHGLRLIRLQPLSEHDCITLRAGGQLGVLPPGAE